ncbi:transposase [Prolixibacter denitrificans]|uniref:Transposase IS200-like domain-containing protein n=1 Tax=Prolixibacter denitrificans TaxID=1541063 RepID=A0A2P8C6C9_9BACT|nr:transposase [Prolixibacter denitrificans]PSK80511.1 hypothetical protein CLV93_11541 [Prolixibacter denitrificans]GET22714.1 hypothetical protein JCM18694_29600 [Prolixibacter denitrificans]
MKYNPQIHHRRSIRLKGYDYAQAGLYFVTLCVKNRFCLFGDIVNGTMQTNPAGQMIQKWFYELENKFPDIKCHEMMVMPNHFHAIVEIIETPAAGSSQVGSSLVGDPKLDGRDRGQPQGIAPTGPQGVDPTKQEGIAPTKPEEIDPTGPQGIAPTKPEEIDPTEAQGIAATNQKRLGDIIGAFKSLTTNEYIRGVKNDHWQPFDGKLWQRNYWEHIIRNEKSYHNISAYIVNNPLKWKTDSLNPNYNHQ